MELRKGHTDNLSNVGHQQITTLGEDGTSLPARDLLHIKCLQFGREAVQENWGSNDISHLPLSSLCNIVAYGMIDHLWLTIFIFDDVTVGIFGRVLDTVVIEPFDSIDIGQAHKRPRRGLEVGVELLDKSSSDLILEEYIHSLANLYQLCQTEVLASMKGSLQ